MTLQSPAWANKYRDGQRVSVAQGRAAYCEYLGLDGSADGDHELEERMPPPVPRLRAYASRTGTRSTLANMRDKDWGILLSGAGVLNRGVVIGQNQQSLFNPRNLSLEEMDYDCGWR